MLRAIPSHHSRCQKRAARPSIVNYLTTPILKERPSPWSDQHAEDLLGEIDQIYGILKVKIAVQERISSTSYNMREALFSKPGQQPRPPGDNVSKPKPPSPSAPMLASWSEFQEGMACFRGTAPVITQVTNTYTTHLPAASNCTISSTDNASSIFTSYLSSQFE